MMQWKVTTAPTFEPITLEHLKQHIKVGDETAEDEVLTTYISAARGFVENRLNLAVCAQTVTLKLDSFPSCDRIELPLSNLISVTSVSYVDTDDATQTPHPTGSPLADYYGVDTYSTPGALFLRYGQSWPTSVLLEPQAVTIVYRAGWASQAAIPAPIKQAVTLLAAHWERNRETVNFGEAPAEISFTLSALLDQYRFYR